MPSPPSPQCPYGGAPPGKTTLAKKCVLIPLFDVRALPVYILDVDFAYRQQNSRLQQPKACAVELVDCRTTVAPGPSLVTCSQWRVTYSSQSSIHTSTPIAAAVLKAVAVFSSKLISRFCCLRVYFTTKVGFCPMSLISLLTA